MDTINGVPEALKRKLVQLHQLFSHLRELNQPRKPQDRGDEDDNTTAVKGSRS